MVKNTVQEKKVSKEPEELQPLIGDLPSIQQEPDYSQMDNLTLLSTLNIKDTINMKENSLLIPGLND